MNYIAESLDCSLLWPATNVNEDGKLINPPYRFFLVSPIDFTLGCIGQKGGFKYFVDEGYLCEDAANRFIKIHRKHNLWDDLGVIDRFDQTSYYGGRKATVHVKSRSEYDTQAYPITYDKLPLISDNRDDIIKTLSTINIIHQCRTINEANTYSVNQELVKRWLKDKKIRDLKIFVLCSHIVNGWLNLANNPYLPYALDFYGILKEDKLVKAIGPQLRFINRSKSFRLRDLNKEMSSEIFDDTKLNELINRQLFDLWDKETSI